MTPRPQQQTALWLSSNKGPRRQPGAHSRCSASTVSRQILILGLLLVTLSLHNTGVGGCGVTIHNEIAFRASQILLSAAGHDEGSKLPFAQPYPHSQSVLHANIKGAAHSNDHWHERARPNQSKALHNYATLLAQKDALFAGSFFPDWGYNCIGKLWNQAAEEAHWPPFTEAAVKYILETYPRPWTNHTKTLIVFLFGTVSHSLGDLSWHGLRGLDAGFIRALAESSFGSDYAKAHTLADVGAEFVLSHMSPMNHLLSSWKVPVRDITEIYKRMGYNVPGMVLTHCMRNGFAGAQANARLGSQLFPVYASKSPFLVEQVEPYPMGGLRDMTEWTVECWNGLAAYLDEERPLPDSKDNSTSFNLCYALWEGRTGASGVDTIRRSHEKMVQREHSHPLQGGRGPEDALKRLSLAGLRIESTMDENTGMVTFTIKSEKWSSEHVDEVEAASAPGETQQHRASLGISHFRESDKDKSCTGGAMQSRQAQDRFLKAKPPSAKKEPKLTFWGSPSSTLAQKTGACLSFSDELESQARTFYLPLAYSSFGHAAVHGDFDGDGHVDLAISAPHITIDPLVPSQGSVFIVPGQSVFGETEQKGNATGDGDTDPGVDVRLVASRVLQGNPTEPQSRFGWSLAVVDLNRDGIDDLAVGAPGHGAKDLLYDGSIYVYFGHAGTGLSEEPDIVIHHDRAYGSEHGGVLDAMAGLGYVLEGLDLTGSGFKDLVVGMPMATTLKQNGDQEGDPQTRYNQQAGKVIAFLSASGHVGQKLDTDRDWELQGQDVYGWFGASFAVIDADREPEPATGPALQKASRLYRVLSWLFPFLPHHGLQGKSLMSNDERRRILVVGSPTFGLGEGNAMRGKIQGYLIPSSGMFQPSSRHRLNLGPEPLPKALFTIHGDSRFQQLGSRLASNRVVLEAPADPHNHQHSPTLKSHDFLVVGSQSEGFPNRLPRLGRHWQAGKVRILDVVQLQEGAEAMISDLDLDPSIVRDSLRGSQSMAHLSAAMKVSTDGKSLWLAEPYARSEAGRIVEWEPSHSWVHGGEHSRRRSSTRGSMSIKETKNVLGVKGQRRDRGRDGDGDEGDDDDERQEQILQCFIGSDFRGRFGSQLLVADLNNDGLDDIMVTSSHSSQYAT
ncbi:Glycosylphosphatidylinositol specific phospholipase D1 [Mortierella alpina]|nr:Glycosylphosphatidylinositol specific phospholipase D1 [Mortierella alpina]